MTDIYGSLVEICFFTCPFFMILTMFFVKEESDLGVYLFLSFIIPLFFISDKEGSYLFNMMITINFLSIVFIAFGIGKNLEEKREEKLKEKANSKEVKKLLADPETSFETLKKLSYNPYIDHYKLASHPNTDADMLHCIMCQHGERYHTCRAIIEHPNVVATSLDEAMNIQLRKNIEHIFLVKLIVNHEKVMDSTLKNLFDFLRKDKESDHHYYRYHNNPHILETEEHYNSFRENMLNELKNKFPKETHKE